MPQIHILMEGDGAWPDLPGKDVISLDVDYAPPIQVAVLDGGMESGLPSVAFRFDLPDGRVVIAQTSARLFCMAASAIQSKYPNLF